VSLPDNVKLSEGAVVVQKFGGSSVATEEGRDHVVSRVRHAIAEGLAPVLVISAMGRRPQPYATDSLISLLAFANGKHDRRELDMLMACGETISVVVMAHHLRHHTIAAVALAGNDTGVRTDGRFGEALITAVDPSIVLQHVAAGSVPVVAGFQGMAEDGAVTTLGRGGSDTSAVALGVALKARAVEIYSDVEGVMTVDPRVYSGARLVPEMSYEELGELAVEGAKVMHPRSVDLAGAHEIPLVIRSTFTDAPGTTVRADIPRDALSPPRAVKLGKQAAEQAVQTGMASAVPTPPLEKQRVVTSLTPLMPVAFVMADMTGAGDHADVRCTVLEALAERGISLDLIAVCQEDLYFIVKQERIGEVREILDGRSVPHTVRLDCAKLSLVGIGMRGTAGVVGRIHRALHRAGVRLLHSTDSNITISCLIAAADVPRAVAALHEAFGL